MTDTPGLRQRQREQTWRDLHEAAVDLARTGGLEGATIDAIAKRAGVSRRTFFNYYPSKEDAMLGLNAPVVSDVVLDRFREQAATNVFEAVIDLISVVWRAGIVVDIGRPARRALVTEFPGLRVRVAEHTAIVEELIAPLIAGADEPWAVEISRDPRILRSLVLLASAALKVTDGPIGTGASARPEDDMKETIALFQRILANDL
ncbi:TetR/AcrR family transcriptional regulator [Demequina globuliformis]|uniref:TetR/AcrR family transcriptional regulator n=1 Tax=Demequina globuliformis TaxID=676202 RepID=UPI0007836D48|nr:TetR/AcrR family transcriptional regulator [Demequina globuliformis]